MNECRRTAIDPNTKGEFYCCIEFDNEVNAGSLRVKSKVKEEEMVS